MSDLHSRIADRAFDANGLLWNALITANSVFVAGAVAMAASDSVRAFYAWVAVMVLGSLAIILLVINFRAMRNTYDLIGQTGAGLREPDPNDTATLIARRKRLRRRESAALAFTVAGFLSGIVGMLMARK